MAGTTALVLGATGLVGGELVKLLVERPDVAQVIALVRRAPAFSHPKLTAQILDFDRPDSWQLAGDVLYSALGTTRKQAGSKEAQYQVDYTYQLEVARAAAAAGVSTYALCSSSGADASSMTFYMRMKGELDRDVQQLSFARIRIARPGMLEGARTVERPNEKFFGKVLDVVGAVPGLGGIKPISGTAVARALCKAVEDPAPGCIIYGAKELHRLGDV